LTAPYDGSRQNGWLAEWFIWREQRALRADNGLNVKKVSSLLRASTFLHTCRALMERDERGVAWRKRKARRRVTPPRRSRPITRGNMLCDEYPFQSSLRDDFSLSAPPVALIISLNHRAAVVNLHFPLEICARRRRRRVKTGVEGGIKWHPPHESLRHLSRGR